MLEIRTRKHKKPQSISTKQLDRSTGDNLFSDSELEEMESNVSKPKLIIKVLVSVVLVFVIIIIGFASMYGSKLSSAYKATQIATNNQPTVTPTQQTSSASPDTFASSQALANSEAALGAAQQAAAASQVTANSYSSYSPPSTSTTPAVNSSPIPTPSSSVYAMTSSSGPLTGTYYYRVSYVSDTGVESNLGTPSFGTTVKSQEIYVTSVPTSTDTRISSRNIYRTLGTGGAYGAYYLLKTIYDNYTTSFFDSSADSTISYQSPKF